MIDCQKDVSAFKIDEEIFTAFVAFLRSASAKRLQQNLSRIFLHVTMNLEDEEMPFFLKDLSGDLLMLHDLLCIIDRRMNQSDI